MTTHASSTSAEATASAELAGPAETAGGLQWLVREGRTWAVALRGRRLVTVGAASRATKQALWILSSKTC